MIIDVSTIIKQAGEKIVIHDELSLSDLSYLGENFHFVEPIKISGVLLNNGKSLVLRADVSCKINVRCSRCLKEITVCEDFYVDEAFVEDGQTIAEDADVNVFSGNTIDITDIVANAFLMNTDGKYLCREDCKGLCPECGADLNEGDCSCDKEQIDPRWEALKEIMDKNVD